MSKDLSRQGLVLVTGASKKLGRSFARYLLKNTSLPIVLIALPDWNERLLAHLSKSDYDKDRVHCISGHVSNLKTLAFLNDYLKKTLPGVPPRLVLSLQSWSDLTEYPDDISKEHTMRSFEAGAVSHELLFRSLYREIPTKDSIPFKISETDPCRLPAHTIWALGAGRVGSITGNVKIGWYTHHANAAATMQLAKSFDNYLDYKSGSNALALAIDPGTAYTDHGKPNWGRDDVLSEDDAAEKIMKFLINMSPHRGQGRGRCWDYNGEEVLP